MDWKTLFLSANGRIGRQPFWIAIAILFAANLLLSWIPLIGILVSIAVIYCSVCVYSKRLHDMGKSGWLQLAPMLVSFALIVVGGISGGMALMGGMGSGDDISTAAAMGGMGMVFVTVGLAILVSLGFLLWVGVTPGEPGANQYGDPPMGAPVAAAFD